MITSAELPLNDRGAVYHLDLRPDEIADQIITVGDPARVHLVSQHFDSIDVKRSHREFVTHTGYIGKQRLSVLSTGIGVPNIDIVMHELDALVNIDLNSRTPHANVKALNIVRLGTAGGVQENCNPGDILISKYAVGFDSLLDYYQRPLSCSLEPLNEALKMHLAGASGSYYLTEADENLVAHFQSLGKTGMTATCGGFYGPQGRKLRTPLHYETFLDKLRTFHYNDLMFQNLEMETAGILGLGQILGHRCLSISVVLANRMKGVFTGNVQIGVEQLIEKAMPYVLKMAQETTTA